MEELLKTFKECMQNHGHKCMTVSSVEDFCEKLHNMGGKYKGFVMTDKLEGFCMLYIDTEEMMRIKNSIESKLTDIRLRIDPIDKLMLSITPEEYVKRFISGTTQYSLLDTYYNEYIPPRKKRTGIMRWLFGE